MASHPSVRHQRAAVALAGFLAGLSILLISGCGQETVNVPNIAALQVISTAPMQDATSVSLSSIITATLNEAVNPGTVNTSTVILAGLNRSSIAGTVTYDSTDSVARFSPALPLAYNTTYTATVTTGVIALGGNSLARDYTWSFSTGAAPAAPKPMVVSTIPVNAATGVAVDQAISATFSEPMNPLAITSASFQLAAPGGSLIAAAVTYNSSRFTARLVPAASLAYSTTYTATITTAETDQAGNALAANYVWTFTTGPAPDSTPPTVVSAVPSRSASSVPVNQVVSATFSEAMNCATLTSPATAFTLSGPGAVALAGTVNCTGAVATFTPAALLATDTLFTATMTTAAVDLAGNALSRDFIWSFTTASAPTPPTVISLVPAIGATGVAINQVLSSTFSEAMNCATLASPATAFTLTGPNATAIAGTVNCSGAIATFTPAALLATNTLFTATVKTGAADLAGNALASDFVWSFITVPAPTPPAVIAVVPAAGAAGVPVNQALTAAFSEAMNPSTINPATLTLTGPGGVSVAGAVTYVPAGSVAIFSPAANLASSTLYTATVTTGAMDLAGNALGNNFIWTFTTAAAPDTTPPTVASTNPANAAVDEPFNQAVSVTFSEAMNPATLSAASFTLSGPAGAAVAGLVTYATLGNVATFTPAADLAANTLFTATVTTGATDLAGNALVVNHVWTFTTGTAPDTTPPAVVSTIPVTAATGVSLNQAIRGTFSEAMNPLTITTATFQLAGPGNSPIAETVAYDAIDFIATLTPSALLAANTAYTATLTTGETDLAGNALVANYVWTFTTGPAPDTVRPTIISTAPANAATNVPFNQALSAVFSKGMQANTINAASFTLAGPGGVSVTGAVSYNTAGSVATFTPAANLAPDTLYTVTVTTAATDLAGNTLAANYVWTFTTGAVPDTTPPVVISTIPVNAAIGVPINQAISATFSEAMDPLTVTTATFQLAAGGSLIAGTVAYDAINFLAMLTPAAALAYSTTYTATITTGETDLAGNALAANYEWSFITGPAPDTTPPTVVSTIPVSAATGVPVDQVLSATFSEAMKCATLTSPATNFTLTGPSTTPVAGNVSCTGAVASFTPAALLATNTLFTATVKTGATDLAGNALASDFVWSFITVPAPTPPTVISVVPAGGATGVPINQALSATFSEAMNPATINTATLTLTGPGGVNVAVTATYVPAGSVATLTPAANLASSTVYTATVTTGAMDLAGNALANNFVWTFTTAAAPDTTPPTVLSTNPANAATNVPFNQAVSVTFSEAMDPATLSATTFTLTGLAGAAVAGLVTYATVGDVATFTPSADLAANTLFTATVTTGATDLAGNALAANHVWTFMTGVTPDTTPPTVVSTIPIAAATGVPINQAVSATFSEAMDPLTITTATFQLAGPGNSPIAGTVAYDAINFIATLTPSTSLAGNTSYTATLTTGETDLAGNALTVNYVWTFTTATIVVPPPVDLGTAALFGGFGGSAGITNQGTSTVINGDIGTTGGSNLITGFHDNGVGCTYTETSLNQGTVNGAIDTAPPPPTGACPNEGTATTASIAADALMDATSAYAALVAFPGGLDVSVCPGCGGGSAGELGGRTLAAGIYKSTPGTYAITLGNLTLDAQGDPNAYWVFQMATTLTVGTPSAHESVILVNGAQAKNVFWQVGTAATINGILGGGTMTGTIIAQTAITISTAGVAAVTTINGRVLGLSASTTMVNTVINVPAP